MDKTGEQKHLDLEFHRFVPVPRHLMWRAWTEPEHLMKWFCPRPWQTTECVIDLRPGGRFYSRMKGPDGEDFPNEGCYLEVVPNERLTWTDALSEGFRPRANGFVTATLEFRDADGGTRYSARAMHKDAEDRERHAAMGFEQGWGAALDQMVEMIRAEWM